MRRSLLTTLGKLGPVTSSVAGSFEESRLGHALSRSAQNAADVAATAVGP